MVPTDSNPTVSEMPIACALSGRDLVQRRDKITHMLKSGVQETRTLADGYALRFPCDEIWATRLLSFIAGERVCCPFFTFELLFEPQQGPLWLHVRGSAGARELAAALFGLDEPGNA